MRIHQQQISKNSLGTLSRLLQEKQVNNVK